MSRLPCALAGSLAAAESIVFSPCGGWLAAGLADGRLWVWKEGVDGEEEETAEGGKEGVERVLEGGLRRARAKMEAGPGWLLTLTQLYAQLQDRID